MKSGGNGAASAARTTRERKKERANERTSVGTTRIDREEFSAATESGCLRNLAWSNASRALSKSNSFGHSNSNSNSESKSRSKSNEKAWHDYGEFVGIRSPLNW